MPTALYYAALRYADGNTRVLGSRVWISHWPRKNVQQVQCAQQQDVNQQHVTTRRRTGYNLHWQWHAPCLQPAQVRADARAARAMQSWLTVKSTSPVGTNRQPSVACRQAMHVAAISLAGPLLGCPTLNQRIRCSNNDGIVSLALTSSSLQICEPYCWPCRLAQCRSVAA